MEETTAAAQSENGGTSGEGCDVVTEDYTMDLGGGCYCVENPGSSESGIRVTSMVKAAISKSGSSLSNPGQSSGAVSSSGTKSLSGYLSLLMVESGTQPQWRVDAGDQHENESCSRYHGRGDAGIDGFGKQTDTNWKRSKS